MTFLITGASGFLGTRLVNKLLSEGHSVNYLGRKRAEHLDSRAAFHSWNMDEPPPLDSVPSLTSVVNLAGEPVAQRWNEDVKRRIRDSRVEGTRKLVAALGRLRSKPEVLVSASAVGYYGDHGAQVITEATPPSSDFLSEVCMEWEREALRAQEFGIRVVLVRIGIVLGRGGGALKQMLTPFRWGVGGPLGSGQQWMPWIEVDDLIRLFIFAAAHDAVEGPLNGTAPEPVTNAQFTKELARALHRPAILPVPKFALKLALGDLAEHAFASLRVIPAATEKSGFQFNFRTLRPALQAILEANP